MESLENTINDKNVDISKINELIQKESGFIDLLNLEIKKVIIGQQHMIESLLIGLLSNGHILLEGVPNIECASASEIVSGAIQDWDKYNYGLSM